MRPTRPSLIVLGSIIAAGLSAPAHAECPSAFSFVLIADSTGELELSAAGQPLVHSLPAINSGGTVAFKAWLDTGGTGIFSGDEFEVLELVLDQQADVDSDFLELHHPVINGVEQVAFGSVRLVGDPPNTFPAIHRVTSGFDPILIAEMGAESPFSSIGDQPDIAPNGDVIFDARLPGAVFSVIAKGTGGVPTTLVSSEDESVESLAAPVVNEEGDLAFSAAPDDTPLRVGIYRYRGGGLTEIAVSDENLLGYASAPAISGGGAVAYGWAYPSPDRPGWSEVRVMRWSPTTSTSVILADSYVDPFTPAFNQTGVSMAPTRAAVVEGGAAGSGCVVFNAFQDETGADVIYILDEDGLNPVISELDELFGAVVGLLDVSGHALNVSGQIAFWTQLTDGRTAIVRADPLDGGGPAEPGDEPDVGEDPDADAADGGDVGADGSGQAGGGSSDGCSCRLAVRSEPTGPSAVVFVAALGVLALLRSRSVRSG